MPSFKASHMLAAMCATIQQSPRVMNCATGATLCACSDLLAQRIETSGLGIDLRRFTSSGLIGAAFGGFVYPMAYARLDAMWPSSAFVSVLQKSCLEIATVGTFVNSVSMSSRGLLAGRHRGDVANHVLREMPSVTLNDVKVWLPYNLVAFTFIPQYLRPSTTALMEASWQTYISLRSHEYVPTAKKVKASVKLLGFACEDALAQTL